GPVDPVGAGDSTTAGILCALAAGLCLTDAAAFGCLVASVTVRKIGTTGTASPDELRAAIRSGVENNP
ncbi:MAG: PfkB family carbohydrate kinase, partial [Gemmataceae bacterium]